MDVTLPSTRGSVPTYVSTPQEGIAPGTPPWPGVVVIVDAFGLGDDIRAITDRFATAGYLAAAPDVFRGARPIRCIRGMFRQLTAGRGPAFDDIDAARRWVAGRPDTSGRVGVVGFCMGGAFALLAGARGFDASAPYYGRLPEDEAAFDGSCPVVASFGGLDRGVGVDAGDKLGRILSERNVPHDVKTYPDAGHAFANRLRLGPFAPLAWATHTGYRHGPSEDAWRRVLAFFAEHVRDAPASG